jgi:hypothetical protein
MRRFLIWVAETSGDNGQAGGDVGSPKPFSEDFLNLDVFIPRSQPGGHTSRCPYIVLSTGGGCLGKRYDASDGVSFLRDLRFRCLCACPLMHGQRIATVAVLIFSVKLDGISCSCQRENNRLRRRGTGFECGAQLRTRRRYVITHFMQHTNLHRHPFWS